MLDKLSITKDLIRSIALYAITEEWEIDKLLEVYEYLDIPRELVDETLQEGTQ